MKDFYYKPYKSGSLSYWVYTGDGRIVGNQLLGKQTAQILVAALNNFILIAKGGKGSLNPKTIAEMFLSDIDEMSK